MLKRILVTGATGNIGQEVIRYLNDINTDLEIYAAARNIEKATSQFKNYHNLFFRQFDFEGKSSHSKAFREIDILFLLRPPHITSVKKIFVPLLNSAKENNIKNVVFLSVQGADKSKIIPHNKIERLIQDLEFNYIFVRPSYFMQNLTTTLLPEIRNQKSITLPSGSATFNWVDAKNIGEATATLIHQFEKYQNRVYDITGSQNESFDYVSEVLTEITGEQIKYNSINPVRFYFRKIKKGNDSGFALIMTLLHVVPRFQTEPEISDNYQKLTGKMPTTLREFIERESEKFTTSNGFAS